MEEERKNWLAKYRYVITHGWNKHYWDRPMRGRVGVRNYILVKEKLEKWGMIFIGLNKQRFPVDYKQWEDRCGKRFRSIAEKNETL